MKKAKVKHEGMMLEATTLAIDSKGEMIVKSKENILVKNAMPIPQLMKHIVVGITFN